jgi:hypothetical protein
LEKLERRIKETDKALATLREILEQPYSVIVRDATIRRFEYTFESFWKLLREYLRECEGVISNSPKSCFREALSAGAMHYPYLSPSLQKGGRGTLFVGNDKLQGRRDCS